MLHGTWDSLQANQLRGTLKIIILFIHYTTGIKHIYKKTKRKIAAFESYNKANDIFSSEKFFDSRHGNNLHAIYLTTVMQSCIIIRKKAKYTFPFADIL